MALELIPCSAAPGVVLTLRYPPSTVFDSRSLRKVAWRLTINGHCIAEGAPSLQACQVDARESCRGIGLGDAWFALEALDSALLAGQFLEMDAIQ